MHSVKCKVWECGVSSVGWGVGIVECKVSSGECKV